MPNILFIFMVDSSCLRHASFRFLARYLFITTSALDDYKVANQRQEFGTTLPPFLHYFTQSLAYISNNQYLCTANCIKSSMLSQLFKKTIN